MVCRFPPEDWAEADEAPGPPLEEEAETELLLDAGAPLSLREVADALALVGLEDPAP